MNHYTRRQPTTAEIAAAAQAIAEQVTDLNVKVSPNGYGHRAECLDCGWSKCHGTVTEIREHAHTHTTEQKTYRVGVTGWTRSTVEVQATSTADAVRAARALTNGCTTTTTTRVRPTP